MQDEQRIAQLEEAIMQLKARFPKHSVPPAMMIELEELDFQAAEAQIYFGRLAEAGFPPAHHSATYRELYRPAYRVVLLDLLPFHP